MPAAFDVIIAGLGAMGSAAACHLARRGSKVLGLDRHAPPHPFGSSHGLSRIIREAYFEHPVYVPMVQRAYALWDELSRAMGRELFRQTGGLMIGTADSAVFRGARQSAGTHRLPCEVLTASQVRERYPALRPDDDMLAVWEPRAGILFPERCVAAHLALAARQGASLHYDEPVLQWNPEGRGVRVKTARAEYLAGQLVLAAGSWVLELAPGHPLPFTVERQVLFWFDAVRAPVDFQPARLPIHLWQLGGRRFFYGFPDLGDGVKVARHHDGELTSPESVRRDVAASEIEAMREILRRYLPDADGALRSTTVCLYTNTPDEHFWIDRLPDAPQVLVVSPCSGHGFKFSSVIGEVVADLVAGRQPPFDLSLFARRS